MWLGQVRDAGGQHLDSLSDEGLAPGGAFATACEDNNNLRNEALGEGGPKGGGLRLAQKLNQGPGAVERGLGELLHPEGQHRRDDLNLSRDRLLAQGEEGAGGGDEDTGKEERVEGRYCLLGRRLQPRHLGLGEGEKAEEGPLEGAEQQPPRVLCLGHRQLGAGGAQ